MNFNAPSEFKATIERPLAEFDFFYQNRGIQKLLDIFWSGIEYQGGININKKEYTYEHSLQDEFGEYIIYKEEFSVELHAYLLGIYTRARELITKRIDECSDNIDNINFIKKQLGILISLLEIPIPTWADNWKMLYHKPIKRIILLIRNRYQTSLNFRHLAFNKILTKIDNNVFGYNYSVNTINTLYNIIYSLMEEMNNCNEDEQSEIFTNLITTQDSSNITPYEIKFNNKYLVIILREIEVLFNNLSFATIIEYNAIVKNGKSYNRQLLYKTYSEIQTKKEFNKKYIQFQNSLRTKILEFDRHH
ncbi:MAG: hypothetical protein U0T69_09175 [Chitinophagales bacterium]